MFRRLLIFYVSFLVGQTRRSVPPLPESCSCPASRHAAAACQASLILELDDAHATILASAVLLTTSLKRLTIVQPPSPWLPYDVEDLGSSSSPAMHKISNITGQARHGWERVPAAFGMSRIPQDVPGSQPLRRPAALPNAPPPSSADAVVNSAFNVPFNSNLPGPDPEDVLHGSPGAFQRWTLPSSADDETPVHKLPVHVQNVENLRRLCQQITDTSGGRVQASVTSSEPKTTSALHRRPQGLVTNVCISGNGDLTHKMRAKVLNETPISLVSERASVLRLLC